MDDCTTNNDNALKAQSKAKLDKYKELAVKENMDFAPVVTGTCGDCYDSFGLVKIFAHGKNSYTSIERFTCPTTRLQTRSTDFTRKQYSRTDL